MTWSARASTAGGTLRPSALVVLRLMISSYLVGACTGRSAGFSPLRGRRGRAITCSARRPHKQTPPAAMVNGLRGLAADVGYRAGLYVLATVSAFFSASIPCAPVINGVVLLALTAPPAATASAIPAMLSMLGTSAMMTRSYSPKHNHPPTSFPPTASHAWRPTTSTRF